MVRGREPFDGTPTPTTMSLMQSDAAQDTHQTTTLASAFSDKTSRACHHDPLGDCGLCFPPPGVDFQLIHTGRHYRPGEPNNNIPTQAAAGCTHSTYMRVQHVHRKPAPPNETIIRHTCGTCTQPLGKHERAP